MAEGKAHQPGAVPRLEFSTDQLPPDLDDRTRHLLWQEFRQQVFGPFEEGIAEDRPFSAAGGVTLYGSVGLGHLTGTFTRVANSARDIAKEDRSEFLLSVNLGGSAIVQRQRGRELVQSPHHLALISSADVGEVCCGPDLHWRSVVVPHKPLRDLVASADDLVARALDPGQPAARYFRRYLGILLGPDGIEDDPQLVQHAATTLVDLAALCLGAARDAAELATVRGLSAARLQLILAEIRHGFADPAFSAQTVARKLGLSARRVQSLLHETGASFTDRVLELRLQMARASLASRRHHALKVSDVAYACGFNDISYFNRCFRRRFGDSPTHYRGGESARDTS